MNPTPVLLDLPNGARAFITRKSAEDARHLINALAAQRTGAANRALVTAGALVAAFRGAIEQARNGDPRWMFELVLGWRTEGKGAIGADGKRETVRTHYDIPHEVREDLVGVLMDKPWESKRGQKRKVDDVDAALIRHLYAALRAGDVMVIDVDDKISLQYKAVVDDQACALIAKWYFISVGTIEDVLRQRKTYAPGRDLKEARRIQKNAQSPSSRKRR